MFTGLVETMVSLEQKIAEGPGLKLVFQCDKIWEGVRLGDSIALNGCCLTVIEILKGRLAFEAGEETLQRTNLGTLEVGDLVNAERSLQVGDRMGGHFVTGHIDGMGTVLLRRDDGPWSYFWLGSDKKLLKQMASKGSVAVDGISLTLVEVTDQHFSVALIPHTLSVTTLGLRQKGDQVNLETDILAKYIQRHFEP